ncbi:uncharacterized protein [Miscanthus floridulus]|uniref:uncharacterized protein n=1 Tax=Miscanthus floridulus TaxID=154761 RepID=UPI00345A5752
MAGCEGAIASVASFSSSFLLLLSFSSSSGGTVQVAALARAAAALARAFGVPRTLTVDNGKQFDSDKFKEFCKTLGATIAFALVYHLESNGAVERANKIIFSAISKTLFNLRKGKWVEELPKVVWSHNTTASRTIGFTPFKLLYQEEAMLLEEIKHQNLWAMK